MVDADGMPQGLAVLVAQPRHAVPVYIHLAGLQHGLGGREGGGPMHIAEPGLVLWLGGF